MHNLDHPEVRSMVASMVNAGAGLATINAALKQKGFPPVSFSQFGEVQKWMKANPGKQYPASAVDASTTERLNLLQRAAGSAPGAFAANTADAFTAGIPSYLAGDKGKGALEAMDALHPDASMLGTITGSLTGAIGGELAAAKLLAGAPRLAAYAPRLADAAFGGLSGFTGSGGDPLSAAAGAVIAPLAGKVGEGAINTLARGARGVTDPAVQYLRSRGIPLTFGQAVGHSGRAGEVIKGIEDAMTSTPGPGNMVDARRREGLRAFNEAAFRDAAPPGAVITATGAPGLAQVRQAVSDQYNRTLDPVTLDLMGDPAALDDITNATLRAHAIPQGTGEDAANALSFRIGGGMDQAGQMAGRDFQEAYRGLARDARGAASRQVPYAQEFGDVAREGQDALGLALERQNPGAFGGFVEANAANRRANVLASALNPNAPEELITPAQLNRADFTSTSRLTNRINAASGNRPFYDLATAGQAVLPSKLPDSGTAKRLALMALTGTLGQTGLTGAGYAVGGSQGAETGTELGLGTAALLTALGTRRGQRALTSLALDRPAFARAIADSIERNAAVGRVGGTTGGLALIHALNGQ